MSRVSTTIDPYPESSISIDVVSEIMTHAVTMSPAYSSSTCAAIAASSAVLVSSLIVFPYMVARLEIPVPLSGQLNYRDRSRQRLHDALLRSDT
jgi:hypothetical protein